MNINQTDFEKGNFMKKSKKPTIVVTISSMILITACNSSIPKKPSNTQNIEKNIIIDGLTYENKPSTKTYNWDDATKYCQNKGWRLPTRVELAKVANIPLDKMDSNHEKWFIKNKNKQNSNLFIKKEFVKSMSKGEIFWTSEPDTSQPKEHYYHHTINFYKGYIGTNEGHLPNNVLCVK